MNRIPWAIITKFPDNKIGMNVIAMLGNQPLFQFLGAWIVLLITDMDMIWRMPAVTLGIWILWVSWSRKQSPSSLSSHR